MTHYLDCLQGDLFVLQVDRWLRHVVCTGVVSVLRWDGISEDMFLGTIYRNYAVNARYFYRVVGTRVQVSGEDILLRVRNNFGGRLLLYVRSVGYLIDCVSCLRFV